MNATKPLLFLILLFLLLPAFSMGQNSFYKMVSKQQADSLRNELKIIKNDTIRMLLCRDLSNYYGEMNYDSSLYFGEQVLHLSRKFKASLWEANALYWMASSFTRYGNYPKALELYSLGKKIAENKDSEKNILHIEYFTPEGDPHRPEVIRRDDAHAERWRAGRIGFSRPREAGARAEIVGQRQAEHRRRRFDAWAVA